MQSKLIRADERCHRIHLKDTVRRHIPSSPFPPSPLLRTGNRQNLLVVGNASVYFSCWIRDVRRQKEREVRFKSDVRNYESAGPPRVHLFCRRVVRMRANSRNHWIVSANARDDVFLNYFVVSDDCLEATTRHQCE